MSRSDTKVADIEERRTNHSYDGWIELVFRMRDRRNAIFGSDLFGDPAWEILLVLGLDANIAGSSVGAIAEASGISLEATRRWLAILISRGHVECHDQINFQLTEQARAGLPKIIH